MPEVKSSKGDKYQKMSELKNNEKENKNAVSDQEQPPESGDLIGENGEQTQFAGAADANQETEGEMKQILEQKERELSELKELMQRRQADFENYKKRCLRQEESNKKMLIRDIALDVISINDNLERASEAAVTIPEGKSLEDAHKSYVEGVVLISKSIDSMLAKYGITAIEAQDQSFDPNIHEAVEINMAPDVENDLVTKVYQKGFRMDDFILRTAKVCVTRPQPAGQNTQEQSEAQ